MREGLLVLSLQMKSQRILVSGVGSIGKRHLKNLHTLGVTDLAFVDPFLPADAAETLSKEAGAAVYGDFEKALGEFKPTVVFICTPSKLHLSQALFAACAGAHLFIEKPLSHTLDGIDELEKEVEKRNLIAVVGCNMRFHPGIMKVRELLAEGAIGDPIAVRYHSSSYLPRWHPKGDYKKSYSADPVQGGAILDCIHEIDLALWQFGPAELVGAALVKAETLDIPVEGIAELLLRHERVLVSMHLSFMERKNRRSCLVIGSKGTINMADERGVVELVHEDGSMKVALQTEPHYERNNQIYLDEVHAFLKAVVGEIPLSLASLIEGKRALEIALEARKRGNVSC